MNKKPLIIGTLALLILIGVFLLGRFLGSNGDNQGAAHAHGEGIGAETKAETIWTCSMHPQVRQPDPGTCPICAMDLIPITTEDDGADDGELPRLRVSERAVALMNIQTAPVQRGPAFAELRLPGRVAVDETRLALIAAWFDGRVDKLFVDYAGSRVREGEHLAELYSPQIFSVQEEYFQALRAREARPDASAEAMVEAARSKLTLLGLGESQIAAIREAGEPSTHLTVYSTATGIVLERLVSAGQYVETGTPLFRVADLSHLWVTLEAYESEVAWLRYGQEVELTVAAFPGKQFQGRISFIEPSVDPDKRTVRVRVNVANPDNKLKPGMLANGLVRPRVGRGGRVLADHLEGRWISPMHPEIIKDGPGTCDVCGMALVPIEEMGYFAGTGGELEDPLIIPSSAPLLTGKRAIVYLRLPGTERPTFEARAVELGNRLGDVYLVESGLQEGDLIVTNGQFKIDSELQIRGRPSMMASGGGESPGPDHGADEPRDPREEAPRLAFADTVEAGFSEELGPLFEAYLVMVKGLAADDVNGAREGLTALQETLTAIGEHRLTGEAHGVWMNRYNALRDLTQAMDEVPDIGNIRSQLQRLSTEMEFIYVNFGGQALPVLHRAHCPMVEGGIVIDGVPVGTWLQKEDLLANPYWGAAMLRCGEFHGKLGEL